MVNTSFFTDGEVYDTAVVTSNDNPASTTPSQAPSSFYPAGNIYDYLSQESDVVALLQLLASQTSSNASAAATSASQAATSAANASAATTAAVAAAAGTVTPIVDGTAAVGTSTKWAHEDHVHPTDTSRAPLASPAFTGTPTAPTPAAADNSTKIATTAWVQTNAPVTPPATAAPLMDGASAVGVATKYAREDHVHPTDTSRAPLASPTFTGTPAAPTAALNTNTTQLATTAFVLGQAGATAPPATGTASAVGTSARYAREDHVHQLSHSYFVTTATANTTMPLGAYTDTISVAQGASGVWFVMAVITCVDTSTGAIFGARITDGTNMYASSRAVTKAANDMVCFSLAGIAVNPVGNLKVQCIDYTSANGSVQWSISGNNNDTKIIAIRIA